ncbi:hypothetical protein HR060_10705 [Catenovulum sp. SM1970]|uniref:hypothetical protein n=1 Tax=Marinifaba aquimaris TaxID=2741323 RepID=UPI001574A685|nr:hypothetical protein [Marinifaba aquimaris]NTS77334.1 hypothetical protein [Marinifaba aquimaris]
MNQEQAEEQAELHTMLKLGLSLDFNMFVAMFMALFASPDFDTGAYRLEIATNEAAISLRDEYGEEIEFIKVEQSSQFVVNFLDKFKQESVIEIFLSMSGDNV